jgi:hypothetical protein
MQLHLDEISRNVAAGAHAVLIFDRAGWHTTGKLDMPENITPIWLPGSVHGRGVISGGTAVEKRADPEVELELSARQAV